MSDISQIDISVEEAQHMLSSLTLRKAPGIDSITADILRLNATLIAPAVTYLFNHILWLAKLPKEWKTSVVVPIPKNKKKNLLSSYCPISLLPIISKVLERHIVNILKDYIAENVLYHSTSGSFVQKSLQVQLWLQLYMVELKTKTLVAHLREQDVR